MKVREIKGAEPMQFKDYATLTLSVLALSLSLFNLYWGSFRRRIALFLVNRFDWKFALVNGGKTDILIVNAFYTLVGKDPDLGLSLDQSRSIYSAPVLIKAGTSILHDAAVKPDFAAWFDYGRPAAEHPNWRALTVKLTIAWIDNNGFERTNVMSAAEIMVDSMMLRGWSLTVQRLELSPAWRRANLLRKHRT
jgi:hypothetical protein